MLTPKTDGELVDAARRGSAEARDELVRRYQRQTVALAAALVNDVAEGEDLGQEAFVRAFRNLHLLADPSRFGAWLRRIVVGVSIDWLRSFRPDLYRGWDGVEEPAVVATGPSPLDHLLRGEMQDRVTTALNALPPRYRVPIRLFHLDGLSHSKIANTLDVPVGTVRSLVARARRKLAPLLADYAPDALLQVDEVFAEQTVTSSAAMRFLHVANGTCTTDIIHAAGLPGTLSTWGEPLYEGPVPGGLSDAELLEVRARYLAEPSDDSYAEAVAWLRAWRAAIDDHASYEELVLWFEHDLFDQLNLIQVLTRIGSTIAAVKPVSLICIGSFPGHEGFKGLGELTPDELGSLLETRQRVSPEQFALAARAWEAFRAPAPRPLEDLVHTDTSQLPFLAAALRRHLEELPWTVDGLSRSERRLMALAQAGPIDIWTAFPRMHEGETAFYISDLSLWTLIVGLTRATPPLLTAAVTSREKHQLPRGSLSLTETGRAVLAGAVDRVRRCGVDRWQGGVHVQGSAETWRWDEAHERVVRA